jgi:hypothetical protein
MQKILAIVSGRMKFAVCSRDCANKMLARQPEGTCKIKKIVPRKHDDICSWCFAEMPKPVVGMN